MALLQPLAWLFGGIANLRRAAYRRGLVASEAIGVPVIVVGNITVGGTGKTPIVDWLTRNLAQRGHAPGIVSRGYGGRQGRRPRLVTADAPVTAVGDEALLLARRTGRPVCVGIDRVAAANRLVNEGVDVIVADDGLQHYRLRRDLEIAVLDAQRRLGNGRLLPAGPLREPAARLRQVDLVLVNGEPLLAGELGFRLVPQMAVNLADGTQSELASFQGQRVAAVAGIGHPARFHRLLADAGMRVDAIDVADHGTIDLADLRGRSDAPIMMTEKDAVKYLNESVRNTWYVPVMAELSRASENAVEAALGRLLPGAGRA
ncbi:MAG: tetraacyldisaccharide 4'-kinase [Gammaproteobacteria bacterium]|nr:tetraacyldisaccharide 4'-kinase [Gammaproteobacteria bacterium]